jgi:uncharacterized protein YbjT (DUF2867 family)
VARILILAGGCRGRALARELVAAGHAVRVSARAESARAEIESVGAEPFIGTPERLATLRGALDGVTIACWLLSRASGEREEVRELHSARLDAFVRQMIDTTTRGFVYERGAPGADAQADAAIAQGEVLVRALAEHNAIPLEVIADDVEDRDAWLAGARTAIGRLLGT